MRISSLLPAAALLLGGVGAASAAPGAGAALSRWVAGVEQRIEGRLAASPAAIEGVDRSVTVRFVRGDDGRPAEVRIVRSSGSARVDASTAAVVSGLDALPALPAGFAADHPIALRLTLGDYDDAMAIETARIKDEALRLRQQRANRRLAERAERGVAYAGADIRR